jgi:hypothetical protein
MTNENIKIEDDFLEQEEFDKIQEVFMGTNFPWFYNPDIDDTSDVDKFQFTHLFYQDDATSDRIEMLAPVIQRLQPFSVWRIKANLLTRTPSIVKNKLHTDLPLSEEKLKQWTTSIFYINTNNGHTRFENGKRVESVANRMVTFPSHLQHTGTSCTNARTRVLINFNYYTLFEN